MPVLPHTENPGVGICMELQGFIICHWNLVVMDIRIAIVVLVQVFILQGHITFETVTDS